MARDVELAYAAGVIDADGCLMFSKQRNNKRPQLYHRVNVRVISTDTRILDWFKNKFEGRVGTQNHARGNHKECWVWQIRDSSTEEFLSGILPYLVYKKDQAQICLKFLEYKRNNKRCRISVEKEQAFAMSLNKLHQRRKIK